MGSYGHTGKKSDDDEERLRHASADPEIQLLMRDPRVQQLLKDLQENPAAGQQALERDVFLRTAFNKLVAAGIIKMA
jgi:stress-induced-phosphoprotein 1